MAVPGAIRDCPYLEFRILNRQSAISRILPPSSPRVKQKQKKLPPTPDNIAKSPSAGCGRINIEILKISEARRVGVFNIGARLCLIP
jgi:hypothetical protein